MSDGAQRVLDALIEYNADRNNKYPMTSIYRFLKYGEVEKVGEDYYALTVDEEKQIIKAFLESAY